jgi:lysyl-tRNA synthetase class 2
MLKQNLLAQAQLLALARQYFAERQVTEVITPVLSQSAGTDPALEPLRSHYTGPGYAHGLPLYLQTSPEFPMKRLLAGGSGDIYQICQAFRNGESGRLHNPEFSVLEWYRLGFDHHQLMDEMTDLVKVCLETEFPVERVSYRQLFDHFFHWDPLTASQEQIQASAEAHPIHGAVDMNLNQRDEWLDLLLTHVIEQHLGQGRLTFVYDYPASQASLARLNPQDPRMASRFELYYQGIELANGFHELANSKDQRQRFQAENQQREQNGQQQMPLDEHLLAVLDNLPDCSGVALGLDRLLMLKLGAHSLDQVLNFPLNQA